MSAATPSSGASGLIWNRAAETMPSEARERLQVERLGCARAHSSSARTEGKAVRVVERGQGIS